MISVPNKKKSIAMIIQNFYPSIGGAERQALSLCAAFRDKGHEVQVLTRKTGSYVSFELIQGIPVRRLWAAGTGVFNSMTFLLSTLFYLFSNPKAYDVLFAHLASSHALAAALAGRILGKKVVVKIGGGNEVGEILLSRKTLFGRIKLWMLGVLKPILVVVSPNQLGELRGFGLEKLEVREIPNGVNLKKFFPLSSEKRTEVRKGFGWSGIVFLFVGRFSVDKLREDVFLNLMKAWLKVRKDCSAVNFYFIGLGPLESAYRKIIAEMGVGDSVQILGPRENVAEYYQAADVFVLPSLTEGLSNALLEAMACGLPVLASRVPGIVELVEDGKQGHLFNPHNVQDIEKALNELFNQKTKWSSFGQANQRRASGFSLDATAQSYLDLFNEAGPCAA